MEYILRKVAIKMLNTVMFAIATTAQYGMIVVNFSVPLNHLPLYKLATRSSKILIFTSRKVERK